MSRRNLLRLVLLVFPFITMMVLAQKMSPQRKEFKKEGKVSKQEVKVPKQEVKIHPWRTVHILPATITKGFDCTDHDQTNVELLSDQEIARLKYTVSKPALVQFNQDLVRPVLRAKPVYKVRIHAVRTANDDQSQAAEITPEQITSFVNQANMVYWKAGIEFVFDPAKDFEHINRTQLNQDCDLTGLGVHLGDPNWDPGTANKLGVHEARTKLALDRRGKLVVFFRYGTKFLWNEDTKRWDILPASGGFSSFESEYVAMPRKYAEKNLLAHEMGHYLHCPHPFAIAKTVDEAAAAIKDWVENHQHPTQEGLNAFDGDSQAHLPNYPYPVSDTPPDAGGEIFVDRYGAGANCGDYQFVPINVTFSNGYKAQYTLQPDRLNIMSYFKGCHNLGLHHLSNQQIANARNALKDGNRHHLVRFIIERK